MCTVGVGLGSINVGKVTAVVGPRTGVVVSHQVPEVKVFIHSREIHDLVGLSTSWGGNTEQERRTVCPLVRVVGQSTSDFLKKAGEGLSVDLVRGVLIEYMLALFASKRMIEGTTYLPVDVNTIKAQVLDQFYGTLGKSLTSLGSQGKVVKVGRVGGSANREKSLEVAILLFHEIQLLNVTSNSTSITAVISWVWELQIGPDVGEANGTCACIDIGKAVDEVRKRRSGDILRKEVAVDILYAYKVLVKEHIFSC
jgi:hypothetical protein